LLDISNIAKIAYVLELVDNDCTHLMGGVWNMKRSKHLIISEILDICKCGASKTRIVYQANLNFKTVNAYIDLLIRNNLIQAKQGSRTLYETTDSGIRLLNEFKHINSQLCECQDLVA